MKSKNHFTLYLLIVLILPVFSLTAQKYLPIATEPLFHKPFLPPVLHTSNYEQYSNGNFSDFKCSNYSLSVFLSETTATIVGNLTVDFYNNDPVSFTQLPFHLYPSGMEFATQQGFIEIINVTTLEPIKEQLPFEVISDQQLMWINLSSTLGPDQRTSFCISFNTTLPDGGIDRANVYGDDVNHTKIFKFASSYPIPCVYDIQGWHIDPYLAVGDPFYFDMAYYNLTINVPQGMVVAATGELGEVNYYSDRKVLFFNPHYPVREVTFSASRYFMSESMLVNGVNISTYFLQNSYTLWHTWGLDVATQAFILYNDTLGVYPYNSFNVVEEHTHFGGMEYPLQVYITSTADRYEYPQYSLELIIAHETAHQWFYNLVGNDEVACGFLDEGLVVWITDYFRDIRHPDWYLFNPYRYLNTVREYNITDGLPNKINQSVYNAMVIDPNVYWDSAYIKTPTILEHLRRTVLHDDFIPGLSYYFKAHYFGFARLLDLQDAFELISNKNLDWFFNPWFNNPYLPKYEFQNISYDATQKIINITIIDVNAPLHEFSYSQRVLLDIYSGNFHLEYWHDEWINGTTHLTISVPNVPVSVNLNYDDNVIVQFDTQGQSGIESTNINILHRPPFIPGYPIILIIFLTGLLGLILARKSIKKTKN